VTIVAALASTPEEVRAMQKDVVCGTVIEEENTRYFSDYDAEIFYFCSAECKKKFDDHPNQYAAEKSEQDLRI
jgi:YHS domain-containing protein